MIRIGFGQKQKQKIITDYISEHPNLNKVYCFYFKHFKYEYNIPVDVEYIEYEDIEKYKFFYRLLEEIDDNKLIIIDELMRTQNRHELIYNCAHHYLNQTPHRIIFEYFPIIEDKEDFMILLNFEDKTRFHGKSFDYLYLQTEDIIMYPRKIKLNIINIDTTDAEKDKYEKYKEKLFDNLGNKHPDTIPRNLQILAGDFKKKAIEHDKIYIARNKRFNLENVYVYEKIIRDKIKNTDCIIIDPHYRKLNFNDFLKTTGITKINYLSTDLSVDNVFTSEFAMWKGRLEAIYAKANLYK